MLDNFFSWFRVGSVAVDPAVEAASERIETAVTRVEDAADAFSKQVLSMREKPLRRVK